MTAKVTEQMVATCAGRKGFLEGRDCSQRVAFRISAGTVGAASFLFNWHHPQDPACSAGVP